MAEENPEILYEEEDLSLRLVAIIGLSTLAFLFIVALGLRFAFDYDYERHVVIYPALDPLPPDVDVFEKFPEPRLQISPRADMARYRAAEQDILTSYGWIEPQSIARIPIEEAMARLAKTRGPTAPAQQKDGNDDARGGRDE